MGKRKTKYNILIVCEGTNSEPTYFQAIKEQILSENIWTEGIAVTISPKPKLDEKDLRKSQKSKHKSKRKKRQLKIVDESIIDIEAAYKAVPVRYVREAQKGLEDGTFDEVWAVFDKDGHPKHEAAYKLSEAFIEGKKVNIAFSSIAFEHWILLHFERNKTAFEKSKNVIDYLIIEKFLDDYSKKAADNIYPIIKDKLGIALINAAWLRHENQNDKVAVWNKNPYTDIDFLVKRLLKIETTYHWIKMEETIEIQSVKFLFEQNDKEIKLTLGNLKSITYLLKASQFSILNNKDFRFNFTTKIVADIEELIINISKFEENILKFEIFPNYFLLLEI